MPQHGKRPIVLCLDHAVVAATFTFHAVSNPLSGVRMDQIWGSISWRLPIRVHFVFHVQVDTSLPLPWQLRSIVFCGLWKGRSCLAPLPVCIWIDRFASWCVATASTRTASRWGFVTHDSMCYHVFMSGRREITFACGAGMGKIDSLWCYVIDTFGPLKTQFIESSCLQFFSSQAWFRQGRRRVCPLGRCDVAQVHQCVHRQVIVEFHSHTGSHRHDAQDG